MKPLIICFALVLLLPMMAGAQSDEVSLESVFAAAQQVFDAETLISESYYYSASTINFSQGGFEQISYDESEIFSQNQQIFGEKPNGFSERQLSRISRQNETEGSTQLWGEFIYNEGVLFGRISETEDLPDLWQMMGNPASDPQMVDLGVQGFVENLLGTDYDPFEQRDLIRKLAQEVRSETLEMEDGTPAQKIQVLFSALALPQFLRNDPSFTDNELFSILFTVLEPSSQLTLEVYVAEDGRLLAMGSSFYLLVEEAQINNIDPPATISVEIDSEQIVYFLEIDSELEPIPAP